MPRQRTLTEGSDASDHYRSVNERPVDDISLGMKKRRRLSHDNICKLSFSAEFFYKPHTISLMFFCVLGLTYTAFTRDDSDWHNNILTGLVGVLVFFMIISILTLPNGPFTRPHPALWRCVLGVSILYLLLVQFLLHQVISNTSRLQPTLT